MIGVLRRALDVDYRVHDELPRPQSATVHVDTNYCYIKTPPSDLFRLGDLHTPPLQLLVVGADV